MRPQFGRVYLVSLGLGIACVVPSYAQPAMSRGQQFLQINSTDCLNRAMQALRNVGFSASTSGNFAQGFKEISGAYIMCNDSPGGGTVVNIVVASGTNDSGVPGYLRQLLQAQMQQPGSVVPPPSSGSLVGNWNLACCGDELRWTLYIKQQQGNTFSGSFSDAAGGGAVNGQMRGSFMEFDRSGSWGKQRWTGQLTNDRGKLRVVNGTWTGDYLDRYPGRNNWHAEKQ